MPSPKALGPLVWTPPLCGRSCTICCALDPDPDLVPDPDPDPDLAPDPWLPAWLLCCRRSIHSTPASDLPTPIERRYSCSGRTDPDPDPDLRMVDAEVVASTGSPSCLPTVTSASCPSPSAADSTPSPTGPGPAPPAPSKAADRLRLGGAREVLVLPPGTAGALPKDLLPAAASIIRLRSRSSMLSGLSLRGSSGAEVWGDEARGAEVWGDEARGSL